MNRKESCGAVREEALFQEKGWLLEYSRFDELAREQVPGLDFRVRTRRRPASDVVVLAPHGGGIEPGTSEIAEAIAGDEWNLYLFEGLKKKGNRALHITSHHFDEPECVSLVSTCSIVVAVHGCRDSGETILVGGLNEELAARIAKGLEEAEFVVQVVGRGHPLGATNPNNICNRGPMGQGVQLEIPPAIRRSDRRHVLAAVVRSILAAL